MIRYVFLILLLIAMPTATLGQGAKEEPPPAYLFAFKDLNGRTVNLRAYKGKVVLINFWATWCVPCRVEIPDLVKLQKQYEASGLQIIGITYPDYKPSAVRKVARQLKVNYPIVFGNLDIAARYGVGEVLPVTIVIDREGKIRGQIIGIMEPEEFEQQVKPLLQP